MDIKSDSNMWIGPALVIVTGANRGFGLQIAVEAVSHLNHDSIIMLVGRNEKGLEIAVEQIKSLAKGKNVQVRSVVADLTNTKDTVLVVGECLKYIDIATLKTAAIFHNAATLGDVSLRLQETNDPATVKEYFDLNVANCLLLTSKFITTFSEILNVKLYVINISSLLALKPFVGCSLYCTAKAARDMMFKVLAVERKDIRVLNYAPGPMPTDMYKELLHICDDNAAAAFKKIYEDKTYVECSHSACKLFTILNKNEFESGAHIDFYDE